MKLTTEQSKVLKNYGARNAFGKFFFITNEERRLDCSTGGLADYIDKLRSRFIEDHTQERRQIVLFVITKGGEANKLAQMDGEQIDGGSYKISSFSKALSQVLSASEQDPIALLHKDKNLYLVNLNNDRMPQGDSWKIREPLSFVSDRKLQEHETNIKSKTQPLFEILNVASVHGTDNSGRLAVPVFQRSYCWKSKDVDTELGEDWIISEGDGREINMFCAGWFNAVEKREQNREESIFMGAVVLQKDPELRATKWIIDGQQRLTTCYLAIIALVRLASELGETAFAQSLAYQYLVVGWNNDDYAGEPLVIPSYLDRHITYDLVKSVLEDVDIDKLNIHGGNVGKRRLFQADSKNSRTQRWPELTPDKRSTATNSAHSAYDSIYKFIYKQVYSQGIPDLERLRIYSQALLLGFEFTVVHLQPEDDANTVFDKLNFAGVKLGINDLIRNRVLRNFASRDFELATDFREKEYKKFEDSLNICISNVKPFGKFKKDELHWNNIDEYFIDLAKLLTDGRSTVLTTVVDIANHLGDKSPQEQLELFETYASYWLIWKGSVSRDGPKAIPKDLVDACSNTNERETLEKYLRITGLDFMVNAARPYLTKLLIEAANGNVKIKDVIATLEMLESFIVRRRLIGRAPSGMASPFKKLMNPNWIDPEKKHPNNKIDWGTFAEFRRKFNTEDIKLDELSDELLRESIQKRQGAGWKSKDNLMKHILYKLDLKERKSDFTQPDWAKTELEHIFPQNPLGAWKTNIGEDKWNTPLVHQSGNLTLLIKRVNGQASNGTWSGGKRNEYQSQNYLITKNIATEFDRWDEKAIKKRTKKLEGTAKKNGDILNCFPAPLKVDPANTVLSSS